MTTAALEWTAGTAAQVRGAIAQTIQKSFTACDLENAN
jgi:hypothetical protein